jgi:hypothetical protein
MSFQVLIRFQIKWAAKPFDAAAAISDIAETKIAPKQNFAMAIRRAEKILLRGAELQRVGDAVIDVMEIVC